MIFGLTAFRLSLIEPESLQRADLEILKNDVGSRGDGGTTSCPSGLSSSSVIDRLPRLTERY